MVQASIRARGVERVFRRRDGDQTVLDGVDLDIAAGRFVTLLGPSGCGKSTLLKILGGLTAPTSGTVTIAGRSTREALERREIGLVFQQPTLLPWRSAKSNVAFLAELATGRGGKAEARRTAERMLELVGLGDAGSKLPRELSGGMAQRVAIARALTLDPAILLMDEPFGALDAITRERMNISLLDIWSQTEKTIVFVTHSISEAVFLSDDIHVMEGSPGRIQESLEVDLPRPRTPAVLEDPRFAKLERHLRDLLISGSAKEPA